MGLKTVHSSYALSILMIFLVVFLNQVEQTVEQLLVELIFQERGDGFFVQGTTIWSSYSSFNSLTSLSYLWT